MSISVPGAMPRIALVDIQGNTVAFGQGRKILLSLFREASCPFCNFRLYQLSNNHEAWARAGLDIIAVFSSDETAVRHFVARRPRPLRMVADPDGAIHRQFETRQSRWAKLRATMLRMPAMLRGLRGIGMAAALHTGNQLPADFLIDERGRIVTAYYGQDAGDHISFTEIQRFLNHPGSPLDVPVCAHITHPLNVLGATPRQRET